METQMIENSKNENQAVENLASRAFSAVDAAIDLPKETVSPRFLNTSYATLAAQSFAVHDYFKHVAKLGSYSVIDVRVSSLETIKIVVDADLPWLQAALNEHFGGRQVDKLSLDEISGFVARLRSGKSRFELQTLLGLAPHKRIGGNKFSRVLYLDDLRSSEKHHPLVLSLFSQMLIERYTSIESRIAAFEIREGTRVRRIHALVMRRGGDIQIMEVSGRMPRLNGLVISNPFERHRFSATGEALAEPMEVELLHNEFRVHHPKYAYNERSKVFSVISGTGDELAFQVTGRSPAEKRFKKEEEQIRSAHRDELVPIEIGFHPFWRRLGHTTLRIGDSLYELASKGWRVHSSGADSARAYLFNNPFFKAQYAIYAATGMPPISIGVTLLAPKHKVENLQIILENLCAAQGAQKEKFSLMRNNCNHGIMRVLTEAGFEGFEHKGYLGFSSVLSFRKVLLYPPLPAAGLQIYPLPGTEISESSLRRWVPRLVYRYNTVGMEMTRALPSILWDTLVFFARKVNKLVFRYTRVRLMSEVELYHMNP